MFTMNVQWRAIAKPIITFFDADGVVFRRDVWQCDAQSFS